MILLRLSDSPGSHHWPAKSSLPCDLPAVVSTTSERVLRGWLVEDGATFSNDDVSPALALLEAAGYIERLPRSRTHPGVVGS